MTQLNTSLVAVVILNWNGRHHLETYLPSVVAHTSSEHVIWVLTMKQRRQRVVASGTSFRVKVPSWAKQGFAEGYNQALAHCRRCLCLAQFGRARGRTVVELCLRSWKRSRGVWQVR